MAPLRSGSSNTCYLSRRSRSRMPASLALDLPNARNVGRTRTTTSMATTGQLQVTSRTVATLRTTTKPVSPRPAVHSSVFGRTRGS